MALEGAVKQEEQEEEQEEEVVFRRPDDAVLLFLHPSLFQFLPVRRRLDGFSAVSAS